MCVYQKCLTRYRYDGGGGGGGGNGEWEDKRGEDKTLPTIQQNILQLFAIILPHQARIVHHQHVIDVKPLNGRAQLPVVYLVYSIAFPKWTKT